MLLKSIFAALLVSASLSAQTPANVVVIVNDNSAISRSVGEYYARRRAVPLRNICRIRTADSEEITRTVYDKEVSGPIGAWLKANSLTELTLYLVTTMGVPLKIAGSGGVGGEQASVDSELTLLYAILHGKKFPIAGNVPNPFFRQRDRPFRHPDLPIYLVTRLAGYDFADVRRLIDRSLAAVNTGVFVIDMKSAADVPGNDWLRSAAILLPQKRLLFDETATVIYAAKNVIAYASWGSNDKNRTKRRLNFEWLPGAIATEYVSTNGRTFARPPDLWELSSWEKEDKPKWFAGSPQTMTADLIHEGASGASGHVYEPFLAHTPRPEYLLPAYFSGRNLAESYYIAIPSLSWMNMVIGDPLCSLGKPKP